MSDTPAEIERLYQAARRPWAALGPAAEFRVVHHELVVIRTWLRLPAVVLPDGRRPCYCAKTATIWTGAGWRSDDVRLCLLGGVVADVVRIPQFTGSLGDVAALLAKTARHTAWEPVVTGRQAMLCAATQCVAVEGNGDVRWLVTSPAEPGVPLGGRRYRWLRARARLEQDGAQWVGTAIEAVWSDAPERVIASIPFEFRDSLPVVADRFRERSWFVKRAIREAARGAA